MHLSLKFENLTLGFQTKWTDLRRIVEMAKTLYPKQKVEVHIEFVYDNSFSVNPFTETMVSYLPVKITLVPMTDVGRDQINPQYTSIVKKLVSMINQFMAVSDPRNDSSVQPTYFPQTETEISDGLWVIKYINDELDTRL